jgi:thiol-disulfide isomerase/thioredoxin
MQQRLAVVVLTAVAVIIATTLLSTSNTVVAPTKPAPSQTCATGGAKAVVAEQDPKSFEDLRRIAQHFADTLGRLKEQNKTIPPAELASQAGAENSYALPTRSDPGQKLDTETIYARTRPGVVVVGGIYLCGKCKHWHALCNSGFAVGREGLIITSLHAVENLEKLEAAGIMTDDGQVFPIKAVLASSRVDDLALLKVDAEVQPLPVSNDVRPGGTVYCLSHPILPKATANCFYTFSQGVVCGKFALQADRKQQFEVLAVTAEYGPGSSGGPILNDRGAVVGMACQAVPLTLKEGEKDVQMVWKFARPSSSILKMLSQSITHTAPGGDALMATGGATEKAAQVASGRVTAPASDKGEFQLRRADLSQFGVGYYRPVQIALTAEPPVKPVAEPKYQSKPRYGEMRLGDGENNRFLVAIDEPEEGKPKIYIDRAGSGDLTRAGDGDWDRINGSAYSLANVEIDVPYQTGKIPYKFSFYRNKSRKPDAVFYYRASGREGAIELDGNRYRILVIDDNADGRFDDLPNGALIIDLDQDDKLEASNDSAEYYQLNEPFNVRGRVWEVASLSPDGTRVTLRRSQADVPIKPYLNVGCQAIDFSGQGLDGKSIDLRAEAAKSRYVLVDFWASWCGPCRSEFPTLRRMYARYKDHGLTVIGVNLDSELNKATDAARQAALTYPHVFDGRGWTSAVAMLYRVHGIPQVYLLDNQLKIIGKNLRGKELEKRLEELLGPGDEEAAKAADQSANNEHAATK